jgi:hypothetical protein
MAELFRDCVDARREQAVLGLMSIAALFPRPELHVCAMYLARSLMAGKRLVDY